MKRYEKKSLLFLFLLTFLPVSAQAEAYNLTHDVYAGGVHALQTRMRLEEKAGNYQFTFGGQTFGMLGKFVPWIGDFKTKGWIIKDAFHPENHVSDTITRDKREVNTFSYTSDKGFKSYSHVVNQKDETDKDFDIGIAQDSVDVLTAALQTMQNAGQTGKCAGTTKIFDGERSYSLTFRDAGTENLTASKYNFYEGPTLKCTAEVKQLGGRTHKKPRGWLRVQEQSKAKGMLPTLWLAKLSKSVDAPYFPVKTMVKSDYGAFIVNLTSFRDSDGVMKTLAKPR